MCVSLEFVLASVHMNGCNNKCYLKISYLTGLNSLNYNYYDLLVCMWEIKYVIIPANIDLISFLTGNRN